MARNDSSSLPPNVSSPPEDKAMPLDLSCKKVDNENAKDDEVIVTLEIPGHRSHLHDPIVISESDSDSDITVVAVNVARTKSKTLQKPFDCKKLTCDSDSDGDDCIIASYEVPTTRIGMKKFFDDSSLQAANDALLDNPIVKGKDPFLSDASSGDDIPNVGLMMSSGDGFSGDDKSGNLDFEARMSPISMHLGLLGSKDILTPTTAVDCVGIDKVNVAGLVDDPIDSAVTKLTSKLAAGGQHSATDLMPDNSLPKSTDMVSDCVASDGLTFGITQLLSSPCKVSDSSHAKDTKSTVDVNSVFHVSSFDQIFSDKQSTPDVSKVADNSNELSLDTLTNSSDIKSFHNRLQCMRYKARAAVDSVPSGKPKSPILSPRPFDSNDDSKSSNISCKKFNEDWKVVSNYKNKVILRRSEGKLASPSFLRKRESSALLGLSPSGVRKKLRFLLPFPSQPLNCYNSQTKSCDDRSALMALTPTLDYDEANLNSETECKTSYCYGCKVKVVVGHLSFCMAGHGCCGQCLQSHVKALLARGKKGTLKCRFVGCNSFYLVSQLRNSLPAMVVEILEEKLDREYCDNAAQLMMQEVGKSLVEEDVEDRSAKNSKEEHILPPGWEPMSQSEEYRLVDVLRGSDEYNYISGAFHMTMNKPRANIVKIQRVQNTILWEFYMVKKKQMERDNGKTVLEKSLFHGTQRNVVEAICRTNFDWRLCGVHGTMYGQGSYFARDANYSHVYTDQPIGCHAVSIHPSSQMIFNPPPSHHQMTSGPSGAATAQIIIQPFPGSSHSVSIAALQSCRFARLPVLSNTAHLSHGSSLPQPVGQGASASTPVSAFTFPYWVGNGGVPGSVAPGKVGRSAGEITSGLGATPHIHTMFVARVLVGEYALGKAGYRKPPPIDPAAPYGRCYDACVNDMTNPTIFVIFNSAQCYPEYIIEYTNRGKDA